MFHASAGWFRDLTCFSVFIACYQGFASTTMKPEPDPAEGMPFDPASLHKYLYAAANPVNMSDPTGLMFSDLVTGQIVHKRSETAS